jgi:predicted RNase H-like nuclease (RuvC/YqgF family)
MSAGEVEYLQRQLREAQSHCASLIDRLSVVQREADEREAILRRMRRRHEVPHDELRECLAELHTQRTVTAAALEQLREAKA